MVLAMRLRTLAVLVVCICLAVANPVHRRQQDNTDTASATTSSSRTRVGQTSSTITNRPTSGTSDGNKVSETLTSFFATGLSTASTSQTTSSSKTEEAISVIPSNANGAIQTNSIKNGNYSFTATPNELPLEPEITPAFIIGGLLLILTGAAYTLIGVKNKWVQSFFSATYLGALCVTVLIIYVMSLPVSNAVQGGYLVAIALTGLILGGGATIFVQMTETLGCLLGGFSFSMWLLVLAPGGLIESQTGRAILIAATTSVAFSTAFSHYTRQYGLVIGTSFSGATAVVIGIDCFSRAGLKEFWVYLWDLNTNIFPVGATSYPVTKGMKVEIAAIIVIFLGGIVSQLELWKVIQERRQNRVDEQLQDDGLTDLEQAEEDVARRIADRILRERKQWEDVYGDNIPAPGLPRKDSGVADVESQRKLTTSIHRSDKDSIEMAPMPSPSKLGSGMAMKKDGGAVIVQVARDNIEETRLTIEEQLQQTNDYSEPKWVAPDGEQRSLQISSKYVTIPGQSNIPKVVPLPFQVPRSIAGDEDDGTSVATFADEDARRHSKHLSATSTILRKLSRRSNRSSRSFTKGAGESSEELVIPRAIDIEDDRRSSIAATVDGLSDDEYMPSPRSSIDQTPNANDIRIIVDAPEVMSPVSTPTLNRIVEDFQQTKSRPFSTESTNILDFETPQSSLLPSSLDRSFTSSTDPANGSKAMTFVDEIVDTNKLDKAIPATTRASITRDQLPSQLSKVVMSYRTNEWAKHLERAENPELEELKHVEYSETNHKSIETAAPVDIEGLQQTADTPILQTPRSTSQMSNRPPLIRVASKVHPSLLQPRSNSTNGHYQDGNLPRSMSQQSLSKNLLRLSVTTSVVEPSLYYANNAALVSMPEFPPRSVTSDAGVYMYPNHHSTPAFDDDNDNISLSARRSIIRQSSSGQQSPVSFNSHQPKRSSTTPSPMAREQQLASWRASVTQDLHSGADPKKNMERSRNSLFQERQLEEQKKANEVRAKAKRESLFDERMRRGDMLDAHRDALRKMQAKANKAVT